MHGPVWKRKQTLTGLARYCCPVCCRSSISPQSCRSILCSMRKLIQQMSMIVVLTASCRTTRVLKPCSLHLKRMACTASRCLPRPQFLTSAFGLGLQASRNPSRLIHSQASTAYYLLSITIYYRTNVMFYDTNCFDNTCMDLEPLLASRSL